MKVIGPMFKDELKDAGLMGLPFSWGDDGSIEGLDRLTEEQRENLKNVLLAHDPNKKDNLANRKKIESILGISIEELKTELGI